MTATTRFLFSACAIASIATTSIHSYADTEDGVSCTIANGVSESIRVNVGNENMADVRVTLVRFYATACRPDIGTCSEFTLERFCSFNCDVPAGMTRKLGATYQVTVPFPYRLVSNACIADFSFSRPSYYRGM